MDKSKNRLSSLEFLSSVVEYLKQFITGLSDMDFEKNSALSKLTHISNLINDEEMSELVRKYLVLIYARIKNLQDGFPNDQIEPAIKLSILESLLAATNYIMLEYNNLGTKHIRRENEYISKSHYLNEKKRLEEKLKEAEKLETTNKKNQKIIEGLKQSIDIVENKLEEKDKIIETKNDWQHKITDTFNKLEDYLIPLEEEKDKLNIIFYVFITLSIILVLFLIIIESIALHRLSAQSELPNFKDYIILFIPVPVAGALLWGFIYQMNRAQRQTVVLAKNIHHIKYVEGLLLAVNTLSPSVEDGITRVNTALDKMIDNHLNLKDVNCELDLLEEEKKDSNPMDSALKIIDKLTSLINK